MTGENLNATGSYPPATRQSSRLEGVMLYQSPDVTDLFVRSLTIEVNGYATRDLPPVEEEDMRALFFYAVLAKLVFVTNTPPGSVRISGSRQNLVVRRLDDRWVLPGAMVPVLGAIGRIEGVHPVQYHPVLTQEVIVEGAKALETIDGQTRLFRIEGTLRQLERRGLLTVSGIPATREGNPDVMTSILWNRELFFHREGVEGVLAAIAGILATQTASWSETTDEARNFVMTTSIGREAFRSVYLPEDVEICVREYARDFTRDK